MSDNPTYDLVLLGGGHAHCAVLADWIENGLPLHKGVAARVALITPSPFLRYSGVVPGWIAGQYSSDEGRVDLRALAEKAGVFFIEDRCVAIDPNARSVMTAASGLVHFRFCGIDTGGVGRAARILGDDPRLVDVRPIHAFADRMVQENDAERIAVIGGGAGGVELAFALKNRDGAAAASVSLITGAPGLLPEFFRGPREMVRAELQTQNIAVFECDVEQVDGELKTIDLPQTGLDDPVKVAQIVVAALGSGAPDWPRAGGLDVDENGFITVDKFQRSTSHDHIFASGDVASRQDRHVPRSGVHAVHTGPVLAANLRRAISGNEPRRSYRLRAASLYILSTANGSAIAVYGPVATNAEWAADLKAWIDKRWLASYARLVK